MRTELLHFNDCNSDKFAYLNSAGNGVSNDTNRKEMKKILTKAISSELTDIQKFCFTEHYLNRKKGKDIASELGVNPSTVSRHICAARRKLRNIASYYML